MWLEVLPHNNTVQTFYIFRQTSWTRSLEAFWFIPLYRNKSLSGVWRHFHEKQRLEVVSSVAYCRFLFFPLGSYFETKRHNLLSPPNTALSNLVFPTVPPSGPQLQIFLPPYGPNPIIAGAERGVFASRSSSLIRTKITRISSCGTKPQLKTGGGTSSRLRCEMVRGWRRRRRRCFAWQWADSVYAWSHGAGRPSNRGWMWRRPCPDAPWLIVLPRESPGRPVLSHWGAEARV